MVKDLPERLNGICKDAEPELLGLPLVDVLVDVGIFCRDLSADERSSGTTRMDCLEVLCLERSPRAEVCFSTTFGLPDILTEPEAEASEEFSPSDRSKKDCWEFLSADESLDAEKDSSKYADTSSLELMLVRDLLLKIDLPESLFNGFFKVAKLDSLGLFLREVFETDVGISL